MVRDMLPCREFEVCNFVNISRYRPFSVSDSSVNPDHLFSLTCRTKMTGVIAEGKHTASNTMILELSPKTTEKLLFFTLLACKAFEENLPSVELIL